MVVGSEVAAADLGMDARGRIVVAWNRGRVLLEVQGLANPDFTVLYREVFMFRRFTAQGSPLGPTRFVADNFRTDSVEAAPVVGVRANGAFVYLYQFTPRRFSSATIFGKRYNANGVGQQLFRARISPRDVGTGSPAIGINRQDGSFVATWRVLGDPKARVFSTTARPQTPAVRAIAPPAAENVFFQFDESAPPAVAVAPDGTFTVIVSAEQRYTDSLAFLDDSNTNVFLRQFTADGIPLEPAVAVNDTQADRDFFDPNLAVDGSGNVVAVYATEGTIRARLFSAP